MSSIGTNDMVITNRERVDRALELLRMGLEPFIQQEFARIYKECATTEASKFIFNNYLNAKKPIMDWDVSVLLKVMWGSWNKVFYKTLE